MFRHDPAHSGFSTSVGPDTPDVVWKYPFPLALLRSSPTVVNQRLFQGYALAVEPLWGELFCLDTDNNGALLWSSYAGGLCSTPGVSEQSVFAKNYYGDIVSFASDSGDFFWSYFTGVGGSFYVSSPTIVDNRMFIGGQDGYVYCLDVHNQSTPQLLWRTRTDGPVVSSPAVAYGKVFVGSCDKKLYCLDASNGRLLWSVPTGDEIWSSPTVTDTMVVVGSNDGYVYGVPVHGPVACSVTNTYNGGWRFRTDGPVRSSPAVGFGSVVVGSDDGNVYCINITSGALRWCTPTGGMVWSSPAISSDEKVFIGTYAHTIFCFSMNSGDVIWQYETNGPVLSSPAVWNGNVYVSVDYDGIYCFGL